MLSCHQMNFSYLLCLKMDSRFLNVRHICNNNNSNDSADQMGASSRFPFVRVASLHIISPDSAAHSSIRVLFRSSAYRAFASQNQISHIEHTPLRRAYSLPSPLTRRKLQRASALHGLVALWANQSQLRVLACAVDGRADFGLMVTGSIPSANQSHLRVCDRIIS